MYPTDDRFIRIRLLINECREVRQRLEASVAQSRALRARAAGLRERAECATDASHSQESGEGCERAMT